MVGTRTPRVERAAISLRPEQDGTQRRLPLAARARSPRTGHHDRDRAVRHHRAEEHRPRSSRDPSAPRQVFLAVHRRRGDLRDRELLRRVPCPAGTEPGPRHHRHSDRLQRLQHDRGLLWDGVLSRARFFFSAVLALVAAILALIFRHRLAPLRPRAAYGEHQLAQSPPRGAEVGTASRASSACCSPQAKQIRTAKTATSGANRCVSAGISMQLSTGQLMHVNGRIFCNSSRPRH